MKKENPCGCCISPSWSRSQNANPTCSPFSLVSLPCTSQCRGSPSWSPQPYPARQYDNDDLQKQPPMCLWSGGQPAPEEMVLAQVQDAAWWCSVVWKHNHQAICRWANNRALMQEDFPWKSSKLCPYAGESTGESRSCNQILLGLYPSSQLHSLGLSLPFFTSSASSSQTKVSQGIPFAPSE